MEKSIFGGFPDKTNTPFDYGKSEKCYADDSAEQIAKIIEQRITEERRTILEEQRIAEERRIMAEEQRKKEKSFLCKLGDAFLKALPSIITTVFPLVISSLMSRNNERSFGQNKQRGKNYGYSRYRD